MSVENKKVNPPRVRYGAGHAEEAQNREFKRPNLGKFKSIANQRLCRAD